MRFDNFENNWAREQEKKFLEDAKKNKDKFYFPLSTRVHVRNRINFLLTLPYKVINGGTGVWPSVNDKDF